MSRRQETEDRSVITEIWASPHGDGSAVDVGAQVHVEARLPQALPVRREGVEGLQVGVAAWRAL